MRFFSNLFVKEVYQNVMIAEQLNWNGEVPLWSWQLSDYLSASEGQQLEDLKELLVGFSLQPNNSDKW
jgi:hypothetical protein